MNKWKIARLAVLITGIVCFIACTAASQATLGVPLMFSSFVLLAAYIVMLISCIVNHHRKKKEEANTIHIYAEVITPDKKDKDETAISPYIR